MDKAGLHHLFGQLLFVELSCPRRGMRGTLLFHTKHKGEGYFFLMRIKTFPSLELTRTSSQPSFNDSVTVGFRSPSFGDVDDDDDSDFLPKTDKIFWTPWFEGFEPSVQLKSKVFDNPWGHHSTEGSFLINNSDKLPQTKSVYNCSRLASPVACTIKVLRS